MMVKAAKKTSSNKLSPKKSAKKAAGASDVSPSQRKGDSSASVGEITDDDPLGIGDELATEEEQEAYETMLKQEHPAEAKNPIKKKVSKKAAKVAVVEDNDEIVYPVVSVAPYFDVKYNERGEGSLAGETAKELLGWTEESENVKFKEDYLFKDRNGKKVKCTNNLHNRPFNVALAEKWMIEILRGKWKLNGEAIVIDRIGMVQDGQHRLVGLIWAIQEWTKHPGKWRKYWKKEPCIDTILVTGISDDDETINTLNTGKPRTLADALYRSEYFQKLPAKKRIAAAKIAEWALKFIWRRTGQKALSNAPSMPHSEAFDFIDRHPRFLDAVAHIHEEDGSTHLIGGYVKSGQAAGTLYLMGTSSSDRDVYLKERSEKGLDFQFWDKAINFWTLVAKKSAKIEAALELLIEVPEDAYGPYIMAMRSSVIAKAWDLFRRSKVVTKALIKPKVGRDNLGRPCIIECPLFGGFDIGDAVVESEEVEANVVVDDDDETDNEGIADNEDQQDE